MPAATIRIAFGTDLGIASRPKRMKPCVTEMRTAIRALTAGLLLASLCLAGCGKSEDVGAAQLEQELQQLRATNQELQRLRAENQELPRLQRDNQELQRLREQTKDLARLRAENDQLRGQLQALKPSKGATPFPQPR